MKRLVCTMLGVLASLPACQIDLPVASKIEHMRVLTAIARVEGDSERSSPAPGERARVTWEMAYPDAEQDNSELSSLFYVCTAPGRFAGVPFCQEFAELAMQGGAASDDSGFGGLDAALLPDCGKDPNRVWEVGPFSVVCVTGTPELDIKVPDNFKGEAKLMQGVICRNGTPRFDPKNPTQLICSHAKGEKNAEEISVYGTVPVQHDADTENHNPSTDAAKIYLHDPPVLWEASDDELASELSDETCPQLVEDGRVLSSDGKDEETITLRYDADAREQVEGKPEPLTLSTYTTFGSLSARFTVFRSDAKTPLKRTIDWELEDEEREQLEKKKTSKYVRFYFTVLDGRGGYALTRRDLCVVR